MGSMATHGLPAEIRNKTVSMEDVYLDLGVESQGEAFSLGIAVGDMAAPWTHFEVMQNPKYVSCDEKVFNCIY